MQFIVLLTEKAYIQMYCLFWAEPTNPKESTLTKCFS